MRLLVIISFFYWLWTIIKFKSSIDCLDYGEVWIVCFEERKRQKLLTNNWCLISSWQSLNYKNIIIKGNIFNQITCITVIRNTVILSIVEIPGVQAFRDDNVMYISKIRSKGFPSCWNLRWPFHLSIWFIESNYLNFSDMLS